MVNIVYHRPYRASFGVKEEKIDGKTLKDVIKNIEQKYKGKEYVDTVKYSMVFYNSKKTLSSKNNLDFKLSSKDELIFTMVMGGG